MQELKLLLGGEGNATATLVAGTVSNVAVVTLPSNPGYEYDVSISVSLKSLVGTAMSASAQIGAIAFTVSGTFAVGIISIFNTTNDDVAKHTFKAVPGQAITCPIIASCADTYYLHYTYIGRKLINNLF